MKLTAPFKSVDNGLMAFSDIDGDGDQDVLITGSNGRWNFIIELYINDGFGNFTIFATSFKQFIMAPFRFRF
jgi:hypothetical protein